MHQHSPVSTIYNHIIILYGSFTFLCADEDIANPHYSICGAFIVISYNLIDSTYYKHGTTHKILLIHHIISILAIINFLFCNTYYIQMQIIFFFEFGNFFFLFQSENKQMQKEPIERIFFVIIYSCTRVMISCKVYQCFKYILFNHEIDSSLIYSEYLLWIICVLFAVILNLWLAGQTSKSILSDMKKRNRIEYYPISQTLNEDSDTESTNGYGYP